MKSLNILFAGTPEFGIPCLEALFQSQHRIQAVLSQPDRAAGRGRKLCASPIKQWAQAHDIPVYQPLSLKDQTVQAQINNFQADVMVVIAYGLILPKAVLDMPKYGCINVHASLLPRWRGASPIQQAVLHGDSESGVTIMKMAEGMDNGDMLKLQSCKISSKDTAGSLHDTLSKLAVKPLVDTLDRLQDYLSKAIKQDDTKVTYAPKIQKEHAAIQWQKPAREIERQIRAFQPWPVSYSAVGTERVRIHQAEIQDITCTAPPGSVIEIQKNAILVATGAEILAIKALQFSGGKVISVLDWNNAGQPLIKVGSIFQ